MRPSIALYRVLNRIERVKSVSISVIWKSGKRTLIKGSKK